MNNAEAVQILLSYGANKDMHCYREETSLFLAAREGSAQCCRMLLDHFANREITDNMERLPEDVANERLHHDIVRLLRDHHPRCPQMTQAVSRPPPHQQTQQAQVHMFT